MVSAPPPNRPPGWLRAVRAQTAHLIFLAGVKWSCSRNHKPDSPPPSVRLPTYPLQRFYPTECIHQLVLESKFPRKTVNFFFFLVIVIVKDKCLDFEKKCEIRLTPCNVRASDGGRVLPISYEDSRLRVTISYGKPSDKHCARLQRISSKLGGNLAFNPEPFRDW